ncbi:MAG: hypothetical protein Kow0080_02590 [Candidatus Promineifilaceae bacterium]
MSKLEALYELGQSPWLNYMRRNFVKSSEFRQLLADGIRGVTANAAVFLDTIENHDDYDEAIHQQMLSGTPMRLIHEFIMMDDARLVADKLHGFYTESNSLDGYVSLEMDPSLAESAVKTAAHARHLLHGMDRANTMVEIPATMEGCDAIRRLIADCESLNITYIFTITDFERAAQAYIDGLEMLFASHSMWRITPTAVASFSVAPVDAAVDPILRKHDAAHLCHKTGIALAKLLYERYQQIFSGPRWERLAKRGARPLRPKWTRLTPYDNTLPLTYYANALIGPDTVVTFNLDTLAAFEESGIVAETLTQNITDARAHLANLSAFGVDLEEIVHTLQKQHLVEAQATYQKLVEAVSKKAFAVSMAV